MSITQNVAAKFAVAIIAVAMLFSVVAPAKAQNVSSMSLDELIALVAELQAQLTNTSSSSSDVCPYTWTRSLNMGDTGSDVKMLQMFLNSMSETQVAATGVGSAGSETEYYGPATGAAVANFQMKYRAEILSPLGLVNPTTYFGNSTRAQANALCATASDDSSDDSSDSSDDSSFSGSDEGQLTTFAEEAPEGTEVDEGETMGVLNASFEADDADQKITRIDVDFQAADSTESDKPWDYFSEVAILINGDEVASSDADSSSDWDKEDATPDNYSMRFSGLSVVIEDGDEASVEIVVTARENVDGSDEGQSWEAAIPVNGIRAVSPNGLSETYPTTELNEDFTVAGSDTGTLAWSRNADTPDAMAISLDDTVDTNDVLLAIYDLEADNQDILVEDVLIEVTAVTTGTADQISDFVQTFHLYADGELVGSESGDTTADLTNRDITFSNVDITIDDGDTVEFEIRADFQPLDGTILKDADTFVVSMDASDTVAEMASGGDDGDSVTATGDITGETHAIFADAPEITLVSSTITKTVACDGACASGSAERAEAVFEYTVKAVDSDIYLPDELVEDADETDSTYGSGSTFFLDEHGGTEPTASAINTTTGADTSTNGWVVRKGQTKTFKAYVTITAGADGYQSVGMSSIEWSLTDVAGGNAATEDYTYSMQPDWESPSIYLEYTA